MPISGKKMLALYQEHGWRVLRQKGSHVQLGKGGKRATIPLHKELKKGLARKLLKMIGESKIKP
jgi:predicted RNA binding protein YcfA (HicA-like mRNA interferase family)